MDKCENIETNPAVGLTFFMIAEMASTSAARPLVDAWNEKDQQIEVAEGNGFLYSLKLRAKLEDKPSAVYEILTNPDSVLVFRNIKACTYRKILEEDKHTRTRKLEVAHKALAKFLFVNITFETRLFVWEDDINKRIRFCTAQEGFMKKFEGSWRVQPFNEQSLQSLRVEQVEGDGDGSKLHNPFSAIHSRLSQFHFGARQVKQDVIAEPSNALVTLEQNLLPKSGVPPGLKGLIRRMCAKQLTDMMEDVRAEIDRRKKTRGGCNGDKSSQLPRAQGPGVAGASACITHVYNHSNIWESIEPLINITVLV
ncbi:hypothetical protein CEUSTIGMA_g12476.t1 [Chlamydomonas eustigma]|uniref:Coenzyme Q-binding protein COQ10 START domain-containing protein n=1 Tax=Chlamydomonas eustigma TaxID=1157962 RepID=A0A250XPT9_9CHLO|nr:hypothetical protein CEUSTIGMA_g12476.t1 [Chlamydomonas eustigma]|eukprot:GAX85056.1 hypothetical protein CEUSTIGMA_g12476.t1 [Chlamydomonas eustigma]